MIGPKTLKQSAGLRTLPVGITRVLFFLTAVALASLASAQQPAETLPGFKANNVLESHGIDHINLFSGDPGLVLPLGPEYPLGPGNAWQLKAFYSVKFWHLANNCGLDPTVRHAVVSGYPTLGAGWNLELGYVTDPGPFGIGTYHSPDGGRHEFASSSLGMVTTDGSHLRATRFDVGGQIDRFTVEFPNGNVHTFSKRYLGPTPVSGTSYDFTDYTDWQLNTDRFGLTSIRDSFGTTLLTVDHAANYPDRDAWRVTQINLTPDTSPARRVIYNWGQVQVGTIGAVTWDVLSSIEFPAVGGQTLQVSFAFDTPGGSGANPTFPRNGFDNSVDTAGVPEGCRNSGNVVFVPLLDAVTLSGASISPLSYGFAYVLNNPEGSGYHYYSGALNHFELPTGGKIDYAYSQTVVSCFESGGGCEDPESGLVSLGPSRPLTPDESNFTKYWDSSAAVVARTETVIGVPGSTTTYSRYQFVPGGIDQDPIHDAAIARRTIVVEPAGNGSPSYSTRYLFHVDVTSAVFASGIELERRYYAGSSAVGTPVRTTISCYEDDLGNMDQCGYWKSPGVIQDYTVRENSRVQRQITWYGVNPTQGGTCPTGPTSCTQSASTEYVLAAGKYKETEVKSTLPAMAGWLSRISTTEWSPQTSGVWLLELFTSKSAVDSGSGLPSPSSFSSTYDFNPANGFLNSTSTVDTYGSLTDSFTQHDAQWNPTTEIRQGTGGVSATQFTDARTFQRGLVLTSQRSGIGWKSFDVDRNTNTGQIETSRDPNGLVTQYGYDALGRIRSITPPGGEAPTTIDYDNPTQTTVSRSGSDGNATWQRYIYDGLGRLIREIRQMPSGYATRTQGYDTPGHASFVSEWGSCASATGCLDVFPAGTSSSNFDPFGRAQTITRADSTQATVDRTDGAILFSDSLEKMTVSVAGISSTTATRRDVLGRIINVTEPDVVQGQISDVTTYAYNVLDKLTTVTQGSQTRTFAYDTMGFLRSENTPEKGTVNYSSYDALGDLLTENYPSSGLNLNRTYDSAGRIKLVTSNETGSPTYVQNSYDQNFLPEGSPQPNFSLGKLTTRLSYQVKLAGAPLVSDVFTYSDPAGRLSDHIYSLGPGGGGFELSQTFSTSGTWTKPDGVPLFRVVCVGGGAGAGSGASRGPAGEGTIEGGGGGGGGARTEQTFLAADLPSTVAVVVAPGGPGGTRVMNSDGHDGTDGGSSAFGTFVTAYGGAKGLRGLQKSGGGSGGGGGTQGAASGIKGGLPQTSVVPGANGLGGAGANGGGPPAGGGHAEYGGGGGGDAWCEPGPPRGGGGSLMGAGGGAGGACLWGHQGGPYPAAGGAGGLVPSYTTGTGAAGGSGGVWNNPAVDATGGSSGATVEGRSGGGGGGGGSAFGNAGGGGNGGFPGGGGGGGGATIITTKWSGAGGAGAPGEVRVFIGSPMTQSWKYNSLGSVAHHYHARPSGSAPFVVSTVHGSGLPVTEYVNGIPTVTDIAYRPSGAVATYTTGVGTGHNLTVTIEQDLSGIPRPRQIYAVEQASGVHRFDTNLYAYDAAGNILSIGSDAFGYDARSRLTGTTLGVLGSQGYAYDRFGNLLSKGATTFCDAPGGASPCVNNRLPSPWVYDSRGNMTQNYSDTYTYDALDRLVGQPSAGFGYMYDGVNERIAKRSGPTNDWTYTYTFRDEANRLSTEYTNGTPDRSVVQSRDNVFLGSLLVASYANGQVGGNGPVWTFYSSDHLGTPRLLTRIDGSILEERKYWPFGEEVTTSTAQRVRFASMERDVEADRYYDHARSHEFKLGRFLGPDERGGRTVDPQSWNRYVYARANPIRYIDPDGRDIWDVVAGCANAFGSDFLFGIGRVESDDPDVRLGQAIGDFAAIPAGAVEFTLGAGGNVVGLVLDATGVGAVAGIPLNVVSTAAMIHGVSGSAFGAINLMERNGPGGGSDFNTKGLEKQVAEHQTRLDKYKANPDANDNKGFLKGKSEAERKKIIDGRVRKLEGQIENFKKLIERLKNPVR